MVNLLKLKIVFNAIPPMGQYQRGTAVVNIEHMPSLIEVSVKFGGAAADLEYAFRTFVSNHPSNPTINIQLVDYSSSGDATIKQKQPYEILEEEYGTLGEADRIVEEEVGQAEPSIEKKRKDGMDIFNKAEPSIKLDLSLISSEEALERYT
jgi:hypothetical protein